MCRFCLAQKGVIMTGTTGTSAARARKAGTAGILGVVLAIVTFFGLVAAPQAALATDLEAGASQLTTQAVGVSATNITVGTPQDVIVNDDNDFAQWFKFTAPKNGSYEFVSSMRAATDDDDDPYDDHGDPLGELYIESEYGDENGLEEIASNDDGAGNLDFRIVQSDCSAGDVYYLKCKTCSDESAHYVVTVREIDPYDISNMNYDPSNPKLSSGTKATLDSLGIYLQTWESNDRGDRLYVEAAKACAIKEGSWQKWGEDEYGDEDWQTCDANPSTAGVYRVTLVGKSPYKGELDVYFDILDSTNSHTSLYEYSTSCIQTVWSDGAPVKFEDLDFVVYLESQDGDTILKPGTDYEFDYWYDDDNDEQLESAPSEPGYYRAYVKGIKPYTGSASTWFQIIDATSLNNCRDLGSNTIWASDSAVTPEMLGIDLRMGYGNDAKVLTMGQDYKVASWWNSDTDEQLAGAPSAAGSYYAKLTGKGDYSGEYDYYFKIRDPQSLNECDYDSLYSYWADGTAISPAKLNLTVHQVVNGARKTLELDRDYEVAQWYAGYDDDDDDLQPLSGAPKDPGSYCVRLAGKGSYTDSLYVYFRIDDPYDLSYTSRSYDSQVWADGTTVTLKRLSLEFWPRVGDTNKALVEEKDYKVSSWHDEDSDATIDAPSKPGSYYVDVEGIGAYKGTRTIWFEIDDPKSIQSGCDYNIDDVWADGSAVTADKLGLELYTYANGTRQVLESGKDYKVDSWWAEDYPRKIDAPSAAGDYYVRVEGIGQYHDVRYISFRIKDPQSLAEYVYDVVGNIWANGNPITLERINAIFKCDYDAPDSQALDPKADYQINSWRDDDRMLSGAPTGPGEYRVKYVGKGNYKNTRSVWITVKDPYNLGDYDTTAKRYIAYDGQGITLDKLGVEVSATGEDGKKMVLKEGRDFSVAGWERWENDYDEDQDWVESGAMEGQDLSEIKEIGSYSVTLEGINSYSGTAYVSFRVVDPADLAYASVSGVVGPYYLEEVSSIAPVVKSATGATLKEGTDYTCSLQTYNGATRKYETIDAITKAGEYRMYIEGCGAYKGTWTWEFGVSAHKGYSYDVADATVTVASKTYTGAAQKPAPVVKLNGKELKAGADYTVAYKNNTKAGTATATVTGAGVYTGTQSKTFKISAASITKAAFGKVGARTYTGKAQKPGVTVKFGGKALKAGTDYTVKYAKNTNVGTATMTITGKGNFSGTKKITFKINKAKIGNAGFSKVKAQKLKKKGQAVKPKVTVKFNKKALKVKKDYTITYKNNKKKGTASIVIKGKGNFSGSKTIKFKIK